MQDCHHQAQRRKGYGLGSLSKNGTSPIAQIKGIMDSVMYRNILANHLEDAADGLPLSVQNCWEFQQDNDSPSEILAQ